MTLTQFRAVLLDIDGTLVDSNDAHARAWADVLRDAGYDVPYDKIRRRIGEGGDKLLPEVTGIEQDTPAGKRLGEARARRFKEAYLPHLAAFPHTRDLLLQMRERGLRLAVATSARQAELAPLLQLAGAADLLDGQASSDDAKESKPDPDIIHAALQKLGLPPAQVVMLGDTPYDVEAARRAGVACIGLRCGGWTDRDLAGAIAVYADPADLLAHYDDSPLGR